MWEYSRIYIDRYKEKGKGRGDILSEGELRIYFAKSKWVSKVMVDIACPVCEIALNFLLFRELLRGG